VPAQAFSRNRPRRGEVELRVPGAQRALGAFDLSDAIDNSQMRREEKLIVFNTLVVLSTGKRSRGSAHHWAIVAEPRSGGERRRCFKGESDFRDPPYRKKEVLQWIDIERIGRTRKLRQKDLNPTLSCRKSFCPFIFLTRNLAIVSTVGKE